MRMGRMKNRNNENTLIRVPRYAARYVYQYLYYAGTGTVLVPSYVPGTSTAR